jgi:hypothetical protein
MLFLVAMPLLVDKRDAAGIITLASVELLVLMVLIGLFDPIRYWWAWRAVGAIVFLGYSAYLADMLIRSGGKITITPRKSEWTSPLKVGAS